jgi:hypothetical protein
VEEHELEASLREQVERRNYAAAVALAQRLEKPPETIRELQEAAIKQYITEYRNAPGAMALLGQFRSTAQEVERLLDAILQEAGRAGQEAPSWAKKRYDAKAMKYLDVGEWISQYAAALKRAASP